MNTIFQRLLPALPRPVRAPASSFGAGDPDANPLPLAERLAALFVLLTLFVAIFA